MDEEVEVGELAHRQISVSCLSEQRAFVWENGYLRFGEGPRDRDQFSRQVEITSCASSKLVRHVSEKDRGYQVRRMRPQSSVDKSLDAMILREMVEVGPVDRRAKQRAQS